MKTIVNYMSKRADWVSGMIGEDVTRGKVLGAMVGLVGAMGVLALMGYVELWLK